MRSIALPLLLPLGLAACDEAGQTFVGQCKQDSECPTGGICKRTPGSTTGICGCRTDESCPAGEICNSQNICQKRDRCRSNVECNDPTRFCDTKTGDCVPRTACGTDVHCLPGTVCVDSAMGATCVNGCYSTSDCPLFSTCDRTGVGVGQLGNCLQGRCDDKSFCPYGSRCTNGMCTRDPNPDYCADCTATNSCPQARDYCLINSAYDPRNPAAGTERFCGVECQSEADCPSGYNCGGVILLTQDQCTTDNQCGGGGRRCVLGEGDLRGFCTCVVDDDCTIDSIPAICLKSCGGLGILQCDRNEDCASRNCAPTQCVDGTPCQRDDQCQPSELCRQGPLGLACLNSGQPCNTSADCLCGNGTCFGSGRPCTTSAQCRLSCQGGGCRLGSACAPLDGLRCPDVRP